MLGWTATKLPQQHNHTLHPPYSRCTLQVHIASVAAGCPPPQVVFPAPEPYPPTHSSPTHDPHPTSPSPHWLVTCGASPVAVAEGGRPMLVPLGWPLTRASRPRESSSTAARIVQGRMRGKATNTTAQGKGSSQHVAQQTEPLLGSWLVGACEFAWLPLQLGNALQRPSLHQCQAFPTRMHLPPLIHATACSSMHEPRGAALGANTRLADGIRHLPQRPLHGAPHLHPTRATHHP